MVESGRNIILHHIDDIKDDIYHSSKKLHPGTNKIISNYHFWVAISVDSSQEIYLTKAEPIQVSMPEKNEYFFYITLVT